MNGMGRWLDCQLGIKDDYSILGAGGERLRKDYQINDIVSVHLYKYDTETSLLGQLLELYYNTGESEKQELIQSLLNKKLKLTLNAPDTSKQERA